MISLLSGELYLKSARLAVLIFASMIVVGLPESARAAADAYKPDPYGEDPPWVAAAGSPFACTSEGQTERLDYIDELPSYDQGQTNTCYAFTDGLVLNAWRRTHGLGQGNEISPYNFMSDDAIGDHAADGEYPASQLRNVLDHPQEAVCTQKRSREIVGEHLAEYAAKIDRIKASYLAHRTSIETIPDAADPALVAFRDRYLKAQAGEAADAVTPDFFCPTCNPSDGTPVYSAGVWSSSVDNITQFFRDALDANRAGQPVGNRCFLTSAAASLFRENDFFRWAVRFSADSGVVFDYKTIRSVCVADRTNNPLQCDEIVDDLQTCMKDYGDKSAADYVHGWIKAECKGADLIVPFPPPAKVPRVVTHGGFASKLGLGSSDRQLLTEITTSISDRAQPVGLVYNANAISNEANQRKSFLNDGADHASTIIGYRCTAGRTQLQIRNSWGPWCQGWAKNGLDCKGADVWVDAADLFSQARSMDLDWPFRITYLE